MEPEQSNQILQLAFDCCSEGIAVLANDQHLELNEAHATTFGYKKSELCGQDWRCLHSEQEGDRICREGFAAVSRSGRWSGTVKGSRKDGSVVELQLTLTSVAEGRVIYASSKTDTSKDSLQLLQGISKLNARWIADTANAKSVFEDLLEVALECTGSEFGFLGERLLDEQGNPYLKTHALTNIAWDVETRELYDKMADQGFEFRNLETLFGHVLASEEPLITNEPANHPRRGGLPPGHPPLQSFAGLPIKSGGKMVGMIGLANRPGGYAEDTVRELQPLLLTYSSMIVALRAQQESLLAQESLRARTRELAEANENLASAARKKDRFLASMSHEFRTPLATILNLAEAMTEGVYGEISVEQTSCLKNMDECGNHLLDLVNDILDLAKIQAELTHLRLEECDVVEICDNCLRMITESARKKVIDLDLHIEPESFTFFADRRRVTQSLLNLLSNAIKFTPAGGRVYLHARKDADEHQARFAIGDNGIGLPEIDSQRLFEPFVQIDDDTSKRLAGTGLGLALVKQLVELHGGEVRARSLAPKGSEFEIVLPLKRSDTPTGAKLPADTDPALEDASRETSETIRILLVEDNLKNAETIKLYLQRNGYSVELSGDGNEAVSKVEANPPDMVLMDIELPGIDGLTAIRKLRASDNAAVSRLPMIVLTAQATSGDRSQAMEAGANAYMSKPFRLHNLVELISRTLHDPCSPKKEDH